MLAAPLLNCFSFCVAVGEETARSWCFSTSRRQWPMLLITMMAPARLVATPEILRTRAGENVDSRIKSPTFLTSFVLFVFQILFHSDQVLIAQSSLLLKTRSRQWGTSSISPTSIKWWSDCGEGRRRALLLIFHSGWNIKHLTSFIQHLCSVLPRISERPQLTVNDNSCGRMFHNYICWPTMPADLMCDFMTGMMS